MHAPTLLATALLCIGTLSAPIPAPQSWLTNPMPGTTPQTFSSGGEGRTPTLTYGDTRTINQDGHALGYHNNGGEIPKEKRDTRLAMEKEKRGSCWFGVPCIGSGNLDPETPQELSHPWDFGSFKHKCPYWDPHCEAWKVADETGHAVTEPMSEGEKESREQSGGARGE